MRTLSLAVNPQGAHTPFFYTSISLYSYLLPLVEQEGLSGECIYRRTRAERAADPSVRKQPTDRSPRSLPFSPIEPASFFLLVFFLASTPCSTSPRPSPYKLPHSNSSRRCLPFNAPRCAPSPGRPPRRRRTSACASPAPRRCTRPSRRSCRRSRSSSSSSSPSTPRPAWASTRSRT